MDFSAYFHNTILHWINFQLSDDRSCGGLRSYRSPKSFAVKWRSTDYRESEGNLALLQLLVLKCAG